MKKNSFKIKNKVTRYFILGAVAASSIVTVSCEKWLEEKPYSLYTAETYFKTVDDAKKSSIRCL